MKLTFSYSLLAQFDNCPEAARHLFILRDYKKSYTVEEGIDIHKAMESRIRYQHALPQPLAIMEPYVQSLERAGQPIPELSLAVTKDMRPSGFWVDQAYLRGKFDVVLRTGPTAFLGDWKSGKVREASDQLEIGAMLLMATYPEIEQVVGANIWLKKPGPGTPYSFHRKTLDTTWLKWLKRMQAIESKDSNVPWETRDSPLCNYCPVSVCSHNPGFEK